MERLTKKRLIDVLKSLINDIENGVCDSWTEEEYDIIINSLLKLRDTKEKGVENGNNRDRKWGYYISRVTSILQRK